MPIPENLADFCNITRHAQESVNAATGDSDGRSRIEQGWTKARDAHRIKTLNDGYRFSFSTERKDGTSLWFEARLKVSNKGGAKDYFTYAVDLMEGEPRKYARFRDFAIIAGDDQVSPLTELARMTLPEPWSFTSPEDTSLLRDYLNSTFLHLQDEGKIVEGRDGEGKFVAFATGLVDRTFEDIYCVCVPNNGNADRIPWRVEGFCTMGSRHIGKRLREALGNRPPRRASYFSQVADIIYDGQLDLVPDYSHLMQRLNRVDSFALKSLLFTSNEALQVIQEAESEKDPGKYDTLMSKIPSIVAQDEKLSASVKEALRKACTAAQARARYMYSSALPAWNPQRHKGGKLYFCLPLCLVDDEHVDTVLVARKVEASTPYYEGSTLYTLQMAYRDARSIQRVDGLMGWISAAFAPIDNEGRVGETSAFNSTIAPEMTPPPISSFEHLDETPIDPSGFASTRTAVLHPQDNHMAHFVTPLAVRPGDTIGLKRRENEPAPIIELPTYETFGHVSHIHGRFICENEKWTYIQEGRFGSDIFRVDGTVQHLEQGGAAPVKTGDELSFAGSARFRFKEYRFSLGK